jgi:uncharacterized protein (DUF1015 family)
MASLVRFRALRPTPEAAARVAAVPYDVVNADEAAALAAGNPLSFLHVSRAEIDLPHATDPYSNAVYATAVENFERLKASAPLVREDAPSLYVYQLTMGGHTQTGVAGTFSIDEYERDIVKKHERTRRDKEDDRTRHIRELRAQTGPVFLTYRASDAVGQVVRHTIAESTPLFDFTAPDGIRHTIWRVSTGDEDALVAAFGAIPALYIADGHHRAASAARVHAEQRTNSASSTFLAVAFPDDEMQVLPYNRLVKDLAGRTPQALLQSIRERFPVTDGTARPSRHGDVSMFLDGTWYTIGLGASPEGLSPADRLDVSRLQDAILGPLLDVGDPRTDKRIDFVGGIRGTAELEDAVKSGKAAVAFSMFPVSVRDLMSIADAGGIMPPKSTWFEPKLRDGLLSHMI